MEMLLMVGVIFSVIGGCFFAISFVSSQISKRDKLRYFSILTYLRISKGDDFLWEDMNNLYKKELNSELANLSELEGYEIAFLANQLLEKNSPGDLKGKRLIDNLKRSLPESGHVTAGPSLVSNAVGGFMLLGMIIVFALLFGIKPAYNGISSIGAILVGIPAVIFLFYGTLTLYEFITGRRAILSLEKSQEFYD